MRLAQWACRLNASDIPDAVRHTAVTCILDTVGVALAGSVSRPARAAQSLCPPQDLGACTVLGLNRRHTPERAASVNAVAAHAMDFDDNCYAGFVHGSAVIVPALLACAQAVDATGTQAVTALVAGAECEYAVGAATHNVLYERGWWTTGVLGPIGAAVAAAHLLRLDAVRTHHALALAIGMACGTKSCFGTDAKPLMAGKAAESGVQSAYLARAGATASANPLEDANGFAARFNDGVFDATALRTLGVEWYLQRPGIDVKRIPVCLSSHAAVDAIGELIARHGLAAGDVERIVCDVPPVVAANLCYDRPVTPEQARFSMPFAIATTLLEADWGLAALDPRRLAQADLCELMGRISMTTGPHWNAPEMRQRAPEGATVHVKRRDGRTLQAHRDKAAGSPGQPLSEAQMERKFLDCAAPIVGNGIAMRLFERLHDLDAPEPVDTLFNLLA